VGELRLGPSIVRSSGRGIAPSVVWKLVEASCGGRISRFYGPNPGRGALTPGGEPGRLAWRQGASRTRLGRPVLVGRVFRWLAGAGRLRASNGCALGPREDGPLAAVLRKRGLQLVDIIPGR